MDTTERLMEDMGIEHTKRFSCEELKIFTSDFSESLGSGGFGDVYKGKLPINGEQVAVKVLKGALLSDGIKYQLKAEISVLCKIHHKNVVRLYGFCFESDMKALVYEFMENESLDKLLNGAQNLEWKTLRNIVIGTAKGLSYLHEDCQPNIIHYDIKPANILLDSKFSPKVGDFGLAKHLNQDKTHITESKVRGTGKYMAPQMTQPYSSITSKCDVYSFGMMLFDIVGRTSSAEWNPSHVWKEFKQKREEKVMEQCEIRVNDREQATRILLIALRCVQFHPDDRPPMSRVLTLLEGREEIKMLSRNPFWYFDSSSSSIHKSASSSSSLNREPDGVSERKILKHYEEKEDEVSRMMLGPWGGTGGTQWDVRDQANTSGTMESTSVVIGPWGGPGGGHWDDGVHIGIKQIQVFHDSILSIQIEYAGKDGDSILSERRGYDPARNTSTMEFDYPSEILKRVTGFYDYQFGKKKGFLLVSSLSFFTNKKKYGPFGVEKGTYFTSGKDGKVVGFHGRCGAYVDAIGLHMEYSEAPKFPRYCRFLCLSRTCVM